MAIVLVEWQYKGERRHHACETPESLATCLYVLTTTPVCHDVSNVIVWDDRVIQDMNSIGMCGHA